MKSKMTMRMEELLCKTFDTTNNFFVFNCQLGWNGKETVDCISYGMNRLTTCYAIRSTADEFRVKTKTAFIGDKNYYVMPLEVYEAVRGEIPPEIGVYVCCKKKLVKETDGRGLKQYRMDVIPGEDELHCILQCKQRALRADKEVILSSMLRCACRDRTRRSPLGTEEGK